MTVHNLLSGRSSANTHPTSSITDLDAELAALIPLTQKAAANGVATLDAGSQIPAAQIPALALSEFLGTVASEAAMLALVGQRGDWCVRTDLDPDSVFILESDDPTQAANWTNVTGIGVVSVDGNTGAVTAAQLLAAILTVDGPGSGLNADLLDGISSAGFQQTDADLTDLIARWVAASAASAASLAFAEDTDNGTSTVTVAAPAALGGDVVATLPAATGTLLTEGGAAALYATILNVPVAVAGAADTLAAGDNGKHNYYTEAALVTVEIPTDAEDDLADGFNAALTAAGAAGLTLDTTGITVIGGANTTIAQGETMVVIKTATANTWLVVGGTS